MSDLLDEYYGIKRDRRKTGTNPAREILNFLDDLPETDERRMLVKIVKDSLKESEGLFLESIFGEPVASSRIKDAELFEFLKRLADEIDRQALDVKKKQQWPNCESASNLIN